MTELRKGFIDGACACGYAPEDILLITEPADPADGELPRSYGLPERRPADWRRLGILSANDRNAVMIARAVAATDLVPVRDRAHLRNEPGNLATRDGAALDLAHRSASHRRPAVRELVRRMNDPATSPRTIRLAAEFVDHQTAGATEEESG